MSCAIESFDNVVEWIKHFEEESLIYGREMEFKLDGQILTMLLPRVKEAYIHFGKRRAFKGIVDFDRLFTIYLLDFICPYYADPRIEEIEVTRGEEDKARKNVEKGLKTVDKIKEMLDGLKALTTANSFHWYFGEDKAKSYHHRQQLNESILYFEEMLKYEQERISIPAVKKYRKKYGFDGVVLGLYKELFGDEDPKEVWTTGNKNTAKRSYTPIARAFNVLFDKEQASDVLQKLYQNSKNKNKGKGG